MNTTVDVSNQSLLLAFSLVLIGLTISYHQQLRLEKETLIAVLRAVLQLIAIGFVLQFVFKVDDVWLTLVMQLFIIANAARNGQKRGGHLPHAFWIAFAAIFISTALVLSVLVASGVIDFVPYQIVPITGMLAGNAMTAVGLAFRQLQQLFASQQTAIFEKLALGATPKQAAQRLIQMTVKTGMQPTIDSVRTFGLVSLPGMMTGLIMAGVDPLHAIRYQIVVVFMLLSATSLATLIATYQGYRQFFDTKWRLRLPEKE
jgi:putative ABC transport system permease protein